MPSLVLYPTHRSLRNDSTTWSVATPTCVAPCSSMPSTEPTHPAHRRDLDPVGVDVRRHAEVVAEQLVGAVDEMDLECRLVDHAASLAHVPT